ncbi:MAG: hypothetical protein ABI456_18635 [Ktedonobacteraceae bacterium]
MKMDTEMVQRWLDTYTHAWTTSDPDEIGALFTDDTEYRWHLWDEEEGMARGRSHIVALWLEDGDRARTYRSAYRPLLVTPPLPQIIRKKGFITSTYGQGGYTVE